MLIYGKCLVNPCILAKSTFEFGKSLICGRHFQSPDYCFHFDVEICTWIIFFWEHVSCNVDHWTKVLKFMSWKYLPYYTDLPNSMARILPQSMSSTDVVDSMEIYIYYKKLKSLLLLNKAPMNPTLCMFSIFISQWIDVWQYLRVLAKIVLSCSVSSSSPPLLLVCFTFDTMYLGLKTYTLLRKYTNTKRYSR